MADPVTLLVAGGTLLGASSAFQQEQQTAQVADFNAQVAAQNAQAERAFTAAEETRTRREARQLQGQARAAQGASGVVAGEGSFADVRADDVIEAELEALTVRAMGERRARAFESQGAAQSLQSSQARRRAPLSALASAARIGGPFLASRFG